MQLSRFAFLIFVLCPFVAQAHSVHMSLGRFVVQDSTLSGKVVMFEDDYQADLMRYHEGKVVMTKAERMAWTLAYLQKHLQVFVDEKPLEMKIVGQGLQKESIWFEVTFQAPQTITTFVFENRLLFDLFQDQQNITTFLLGDQKVNLVFTHGRSKQAVFK